VVQVPRVLAGTDGNGSHHQGFATLGGMGWAKPDHHSALGEHGYSGLGECETGSACERSAIRGFSQRGRRLRNERQRV
jgi:hypothetical protein